MFGIGAASRRRRWSWRIIAAGIVVGKVGTVPVEKHELLAALAPQIALHAEDKVVSREELVQRVALWKANGERVVFTNGCFDLLHIGHITVLEQARRFGDRLIVAINSDASVRGLKGPTRPIVGERERARVLAALAAVDAVVVFGEPTPLELIVATRPDVIVKGGDYDVDTVVGRERGDVVGWAGEDCADGGGVLDYGVDCEGCGEVRRRPRSLHLASNPTQWGPSHPFANTSDNRYSLMYLYFR